MSDPFTACLGAYELGRLRYAIMQDWVVNTPTLHLCFVRIQPHLDTYTTQVPLCAKPRAQGKDDTPVLRMNTRAGIKRVLPSAGGPADTTGTHRRS